ncbi:MAG: AAA family ATPase [Sphingobacteriaceae bacterium]|nr:AAA family ATPase [Sphingobacteriaceae bacterium]
MKITKLKIKGYKDLDINIEHRSDVIAFIGLNGSGKSNTIEAICYIFMKLYHNKTQHLTSICKSIKFEFEISYALDGLNDRTIIKLSNNGIETFVDGNIKNLSINDKDLLPKNLVVVYSGEEKRLWVNYFQPVFVDFINSVTSGVFLSSIKMNFLSRRHWGISLLTLLLSESEDNKYFTEKTLRIHSVSNIEFKFETKKYKNWNNSQTKDFVKLIDFKNSYNLGELKQLFKSLYSDVDIFEYLYNAIASEMISDIKITFNKDLTLNDLSEGEKKLLLLKASFEFVSQDDSLFLLDEPDSHIHLNNKPQIINIINQYKHNRQFILTTHSPTLTQCIKDVNNDNQDRVYVLDRGKNIDSAKTKEIDYLAGDFWSAQQQTAFLSTKKDVVLLVEGKHDKSHILNAWKHYRDDYPDLDFEVFDLGGEKNLVPMLVGLREAKIFDKKYIAIFDNDKAGQESFSKDKFEKNNENKYFAKLKCQYLDSSFFGVLLPKRDGHDGGFTIENMFKSNVYQDAFSIAMNKQNYFNASIDDITTNIQNSAKHQLEIMSRDFSKEEFSYFKKLFDIIHKIANLSNPVPLVEVQSDAITPLQPQINDSVNLENSTINLDANLSSIVEHEQSSLINNEIAIFADYAPRGQPKVHYTAIFNKDNKSVVYDGVTYQSANQAMGFIRESVGVTAGQRAGVFWKYLDDASNTKPLSDLL